MKKAIFQNNYADVWARRKLRAYADDVQRAARGGDYEHAEYLLAAARGLAKEFNLSNAAAESVARRYSL